MNLNEQLQRLGDGEIDDLSIAHDALSEIVQLRLHVAELTEHLSSLQNRFASDSGVCCEIRTGRDYTNEGVSYMVFVVDGKSMPYLHIPESMPDGVLDRILAKLNA